MTILTIIVCVKQVPASSNVDVDPVTGVLKRDGTNVKLNPYDLFALEMAFRLKEDMGGCITALSMGPSSALSSLLETVYMGADKGVLLSDRVFAGSDVQATSYALKCGVNKIGSYDLIICGKQTTDGDTAQVGPELAEQLGIEHASNVISVDSIDGEYITVTLNLDDVYQTQKMKLPCLLTIEKDACTPRLPSFRRKLAAPPDCIQVYTADQLEDIDRSKCGLKGSPTQVERIFPPDSDTKQIIFEGDAETLSKELYSILTSEKIV